MEPLSAALDYWNRGFVPIPIVEGGKRPTQKDWVNFQPCSENLYASFASGTENVGLLLGKRSGGLIDVDLDCPIAIQLALRFLPATGLRHGRCNKGTSHYFYAAAGAVNTQRFKDPIDGSMLVEIRSDGAQTVVPPSRLGADILEWSELGSPSRVEAMDLESGVRRLAAATLLAKRWPDPGSRHDAALALGGVLARGGWAQRESVDFVCAVAEAGGDEEHTDRSRDVETTFRRIHRAEPTTGGPTLTEILGEEITGAAYRWLGIVEQQHSVSKCSIELTRVSDVQTREIRWLWPRWIPRAKVSVLDGDPGLGKTTFALDLIARTTTGSLMPDGSKVSRNNALFMSAEDDIADTIKPRLQAMEADMERVFVFSGLHRNGALELPTFPKNIDGLEEAIRRANAAIVVIDPLAAFLSSEIDAHKDQSIRSLFAHLKQLAESTGAAILVIRHLNKREGAKALYRGGGSIGIVAAARVGLLLGQHPEIPDHRVLTITKSNVSAFPPAQEFSLSLGKNGASRIEWIGETDLSAEDVLGAPKSDTVTKLSCAEQLLLDELKSGPRTRNALEEVSASQGIGWRTMERAKINLAICAKRRGFGPEGESWWELPNQHTPPATED